MRKNKKKIVIFDACGTLTKTNNTYSFVLFVCKHNKFNYVRYFINVFLIDVFSLLGVGNFYDKRRVIKLLKGYSKDQLKKYSLEYAKLLYKKNLVNENLLGQLKKYKKLGYRVILLSASFDISI